MTEHLNTALRLSTPEDMNWIVDCFFKAQREIYPNKYIANFSEVYNGHIHTLVAKSITSILCLDDDPYWIISFATYQSFERELVIHFAYTRADQRRQGHLNKIIDNINFMKAPIVFTHPCKNENIMKYMCSKYTFDPYLLRLL